MDRIAKIALAASGLALGFQLLVPPVVGLANNGDFSKVIGLFDLAWPVEDEFKYAVTTYKVDPKVHWFSGFYSSEIPLAGAAVLLNRTIFKTPVFDLRCMGVVHGGLFVAALGMVLSALRVLPRGARILISALLVLLFTDALYATNFNSFFMDAGAIVFLAFAAAFYVRARQSRRPLDSAALIISCLLLVTTKPQHAILSIPIAGLLAWHFWRARSKRLAAISSTAVLAAGAVGLTIAAPATWYPLTAFNVIFMKILPTSKDVPHDLGELGLDASYSRYAGTFVYWPTSPMGDPAFAREFGRRTSHARIGRFLLSHPARAYRFLREALSEAGRIRPPLGNFDRSIGLPEFTETQALTFSSGFKRALFEGRGSRYLFFFLLLAAALILLSQHRAGALALATMGMLSMLVAGLGDSTDHPRHFLVFHTIVDIMIVGLFASVAQRWAAKRNSPPAVAVASEADSSCTTA